MSLETSKRIRYGRIDDEKEIFPKNTLITQTTNDGVFFGISRCNMKYDHFRRETGKMIADGRALLALEDVKPEKGKFIIHSTGLRGFVDRDNIRDLLDYFYNVDDLRLQQARVEARK